MKNYLYNVNVYGENDEATFRTNDVRDALDSFLKAGAQGIHCDLLNGCTGEVLAIANCPDCEDYATDETMLMIMGMLFEVLEGEELAPEPVKPEAPVSGVCCDAAPDDLLMLLEQMVAEGKAVKLGGLPS